MAPDDYTVTVTDDEEGNADLPAATEDGQAPAAPQPEPTGADDTLAQIQADMAEIKATNERVIEENRNLRSAFNSRDTEVASLREQVLQAGRMQYAPPVQPQDDGDFQGQAPDPRIDQLAQQTERVAMTAEATRWRQDNPGYEKHWPEMVRRLQAGGYTVYDANRQLDHYRSYDSVYRAIRLEEYEKASQDHAGARQREDDEKEKLKRAAVISGGATRPSGPRTFTKAEIEKMSSDEMIKHGLA